MKAAFSALYKVESEMKVDEITKIDIVKDKDPILELGTEK